MTCHSPRLLVAAQRLSGGRSLGIKGGPIPRTQQTKDKNRKTTEPIYHPPPVKRSAALANTTKSVV